MPPRSGAAFGTNLSVERPSRALLLFGEAGLVPFHDNHSCALGSFVPALAVQSILDPASGS
jgi:hypothetical protein